MNKIEHLLTVEGLSIEFETDQGVVRAVDQASFSLNAGETLGLVGESGCGKTVTALSLLGLLPEANARIVEGSIKFMGQEITCFEGTNFRALRGREIAMIFQEPMTALNPVFQIGTQMADVFQIHQNITRKQARLASIDMLAKVGIPSPDKRIYDYPHQLSGGMRQRVMIAMALSCGPKLLIADEPTTALDVTTQAQVLDLIVDLQSEFGMAMILITHDLGVIAESCQRAIIMYCGNIIESSSVENIFRHPKHPYTKGLLGSIPKISNAKRDFLPVIPGMVPDMFHLPKGCLFQDRCERALPDCSLSRPSLENKGPNGSFVACYNPN
ncbi:MAG: ABC transporter ATP-binding protein [Pseudomonadota bacterium]|nr:ABC transporter ATP-binding protein [Pseudomonadota bacterium]